MKPMRRFGPAWNPNMAELEEVPIPVGQVCAWCDEPIEATHFGIIMDAIASLEPDGPFQVTEAPYHYECQLRQTLGPVNHLKKLCKHGGNATQPCVPTELTTRRQDAIAATYFWEGRESGRGDSERNMQFRLDSARRFFEGITKSASPAQCHDIARLALDYMTSKEAELGRPT